MPEKKALHRECMLAEKGTECDSSRRNGWIKRESTIKRHTSCQAAGLHRLAEKKQEKALKPTRQQGKLVGSVNQVCTQQCNC